MVLQYSHKDQMPHSVLVSHSADDSMALKREGGSYHLSRQVADGYLQTQQVSPGLCLMQSELSFSKDTVFREDYPECRTLLLSFCLDGIWEWNYREARYGSYQLSPTECSLQSGTVHQCEDCYTAGKTYRSLSVSLDQNRFSDFSAYLEAAHLLRPDHKICTHVFASTPRVRLILQQLLECPPQQQLRRLYLEGKILELLSVFCSDILEKKESGSDISKGDYQCLIRARAFIDEHFLHPLTIAQIAGASYLSETKLKRGFKTCFGCTVYEYIMEKRMEMAYNLMQTERYKVKDVAWMVGYSNVSHFIDAFRNRYGITPGGIS